jgi:AraC-like DNA-binding protein
MTDAPDVLTEAPAYNESTMDALSDVLRVVRLTGGVFLDAEFTAPWCVMAQVGPEDCRPYLSTPKHLIAYHCVVEGRLLLQTEGDAAVDVRAGEIILLPRNDAHRIGSSFDARAIRADDLIQPSKKRGLARIVHGGGGERTRIVCGFLGCETPFNPLVATLPKIMKLDMRAAASGQWIESLFQFAASEASTDRIGSATVLSKLSELLFVEAVRRYVAELRPQERGWLAGLGDPIVGRALALLHARHREAWTAEQLAQEAGLSRSAFAERFTSLIGQPPMQYLALWRMQLAAQRLKENVAPIAKIAFEVGYESEAAFSRAFKRQFGVPPATWRKGASSF